MQLKDKVVLITGGGRGIGRAAAERFAAEGCKIAICARSEGELFGTAKVIEEAGGLVRPFRLDISVRRDVQRMVAQTVSDWGAIDVLINNASVLGPSEPIATYPPRPGKR
ncbi:MAG: SDR family NAD(P)-dependent oxidoreductase [Candidatus Manganitrophus sp.]|nr:MAG: SDR family NAD(P)-dependent oxidoreductase [Candidatus Manganitrophus sp.]